VEKSKENEEILKDKIFLYFSNSLNEPNRQQVYIGQLSGLIYEWYRDYFRIKDKISINDMGLEIVRITINLLKDKKENIKNSNNLIGYLSTIFKNKTIEYYRKYDKFGSRERKDVIRMFESHLGRKLTETERTERINRWYDYDNAMKEEGSSFTSNNISQNPLSIYINSENAAIIRQAIKTVLDKKQDRSRDCLRALLTLRLIDFEDLHPVLDSKIIDRCRQPTAKLRQYEIYQEYHPETTTKDGAEAQASKNLKDLLSSIEKYIKEKNPDIIL